jgi:dTDP-4-dehydrorhamnose reductase
VLRPRRLSGRPELWGGFECTVNRAGDEYFDQLERSGHAARPEDLDRAAALGIRALRYPVLWERTAPHSDGEADWRWADARLSRIRALQIRPIVGFVHHGSGPRHTQLTDRGFADGLARFARAFAERYPWVDAYTPVNEPLTTARFSGLYGLWYPHGRDDHTFARALVEQCRAVALTMRAVRAVNPHAGLVQTEDLGKTYSTGRLRYQAEFENERRWLTWDLLCGRVDPPHPMWSYLRWAGIGEADLEFFRDQPCPPTVIGINHYLTSERFLDHRQSRYPTEMHGGNGSDAYADVEAVRACAREVDGPSRLLLEAWERYRLPLAVTEVHLGCTREEQLRWFAEVWDAASTLRERTVDVRAVTAWSLVGAFDWNTLLTRVDGHYEPGAFDLRAPEPRPTALARMLQDAAAGRVLDHPVLDTPGWWRRQDRLAYAPARIGSGAARRRRRQPWQRRHAAREVLITGATGTLGAAFARICRTRGIAHRLVTRGQMDIADAEAVERVLAAARPWAVVNTAGYVRVDEAEREPARCFRENADGPATLAEACARHGIALVTFSSDLVFGGDRTSAYLESHPVRPLCVYGRSKAEAEVRVLAALPAALVVRTSAFFGPWDEYNFVTGMLRALAAGGTWTVTDDALISPTYVPDLVHASLDLLVDGERGIWHLSNAGSITWGQLARTAAAMAGLDPAHIQTSASEECGRSAARPRYSVLGSERGVLLGPLQDALRRYIGDAGFSPGSSLP